MVISGIAKGIDAAALEGALTAGAPVAAVLDAVLMWSIRGRTAALCGGAGARLSSDRVRARTPPGGTALSGA